MNLLKETMRDLRENGKSLKDVVWIGTEEAEIPLEVFKKLADAEYDSSYGAQHVAVDLVICGDGWYMERHEYDGSEWWEFKEQPKRPARKVEPLRVLDNNQLWASLKEMNHPDGKYGDAPFDWEGMEINNEQQAD